MLRPARMCRLDCLIEEGKKSRVIESLHKKGITQIEFLEDSHLEENKIERDRPLERVTEVSKLLLRTRKVIDSLSKFERPPALSIIEDLLSVDRTEKREVKALGYSEVIKTSEKVLGKTEEIVENLSGKIYELEMKKASISEKVKSYERFRDMRLRLEHLGDSRYLYTVVGMVPGRDLPSLKSGLEKKLGKEFIVVVEGIIENRNILTLCVPLEKKEELNSILREFEFERITIEGRGDIKDILDRLNRELSETENELEKAGMKLKEMYKEYYRDLLVAEELLEIEKERCEIFISFGKTKRTVLMQLWVPKKNCEETENLINRETEKSCIIQKEMNPKEAPILLDNPKPLKPFEPLTRLFGLPRYNEIDPTILIAPTFCLFFGIMLTDAVYGFFLILAGIMIRKSFGRYSDTAKNGGIIIMGCGLSAIFFGLLTGSYLGDFLAKDILGTTSQKLALWLDPMYGGNAITFLLLVCGIGLVHIYSGYLYGAWDSLKRGERKKAITNYISWYILLVGVIFTLLANFPGGNPMLPQVFMYPGIVIAIAGLILLFFGVGAMAFLDLIGIVGNTLSYARLLALGLTTAGIAISFNFLARMVTGVPYIGIVLAIVIFIFGHVINILVNSLGAFVHSLRLHYVEHFGTYYAGGGNEFKPFAENRKYTFVKKV